MPGVLFLPALDAGASREEVIRLVQKGCVWLASRGSSAVVIAVPDTWASAIAWLQEIGITPQLSTLTMARRLGVAGGLTVPPKGP